jgi:hypothetical protein
MYHTPQVKLLARLCTNLLIITPIVELIEASTKVEVEAVVAVEVPVDSEDTEAIGSTPLRTFTTRLVRSYMIGSNIREQRSSAIAVVKLVT